MFKAINAYELGKNRKKDFGLFLLAFLLFLLFGIAYQHYRFGLYGYGNYATTLLAFSYLKYGFFRRGLVGTLFDLVCKVIPSAFSYKGALWFMWGMNAVYYTALLLGTKYLFSKIKDDKVYKGAYFFAMICFAFLVPAVCASDGIRGFADTLQIAVCILQIYLLVEMKAEWLTLLLTPINALFHEGYVIMTFCAVLIVLIYRAVNTEGKRLKYWLLTVGNIAVLGAVTLLSIKKGTPCGEAGYDAAKAAAMSLNAYGDVHWNLLAMLTAYLPPSSPIVDDAAIVAENANELPYFLICFIPVFFIFIKAFVLMFKEAGKNNIVVHILALILGPALIGIQYIKFCDYGRYIVWLMFYFLTVFLAFAAMDDRGAKGALSESFGKYSNVKAVLIVALMMIYQPLPCCSFTHISHWLSTHLFK